MSKSSIGTEPVYDARTLGKPRMFILGLQHMFAMFGATVLVPALSGLDVATTLLFAGIGTLLFHLLTKGKVPAFLGSSFAFIGGYNAVRTIGTNADGSAIYNNDLLAYACFGVAIAGLMYIILSTLFKIFGVKKVMRYFPPIVTGPIIIAIVLTLSSSAITNCRANWLVAVVAILIVIGFNMWGKGMAKIIPILLGVLGSYIFALIVDPAERASVAAAVSSAKWFGLPIFWKNSVFHLFAGPVDSGVLWSAVLTVVPLSLATMVEHIGDICAISSTCGKNFMVDPGFHRTLLGDGLATTLASLFGAPANTTYGENTGVLALSRVYDPRVIRIAACIAIVVSFCPKFAALVSAMPTATIGGATSSRTRSTSPTPATSSSPRSSSCSPSASPTPAASRSASYPCRVWLSPPSWASCSTPSCPARTTPSSRTIRARPLWTSRSEPASKPDTHRPPQRKAAAASCFSLPHRA